MPHIAGERRIAVGNRLPLADEAAQRFHERLGFFLLRGIGKLLIGIGCRWQAILRGRRRSGQGKLGEQDGPAPHFIFSSLATISGTCS